jgi:hypothetical protein
MLILYCNDNQQYCIDYQLFFVTFYICGGEFKYTIFIQFCPIKVYFFYPPKWSLAKPQSSRLLLDFCAAASWRE